MKIWRTARAAATVFRRILSRRKAVANIRRLQSGNSILAPDRFVIGVYFADATRNLYQMRQWYEPLKELAKSWPIMVIARNASGAEALIRESGLTVVYAPRVRDLEQLVASQPLKLMLYVNQNTRNFQMLRYGSRFHVFINHGESDKMYMTTNQIKAYDYALIAGEAAYNRLNQNVWNYDVDERTIQVGRPQIDFLKGEPPYPADERTTVLYSPTWEGDRPAASYGSIVSHGEIIAESILRSTQHRLVYRPHPRTGVVSREFAQANKRIINAIHEANQRDPMAGHMYDDSPQLTWQLATPDVAICDISAMVYDRLATGKPLLVTRPVSEAASVDENGYLSVCEWLEADQSHSILARVDALLTDEQLQKKQRFWSKHYFGDTSAGAPSARLHEAIQQLVARWEEVNSDYAGRSPRPLS